MRRLREFLMCFGVSLTLTACHRSPSMAGGVAAKPSSSSQPPADLPGTFVVAGIETCILHSPLVVLRESSAWTGAPEGLPTVTVYEDGLVITATRDMKNVPSVVSARVDAPTNLARDLDALGVSKLDPNINLAPGATDQPSTTLLYRVGKAWRGVRIVGFKPDDAPRDPPEFTALGIRADPPPAFAAAYRLLRRGLHTHEPKPFVPTEYRVKFTDPAYAGDPATNWPAGVPAPTTLMPDKRFLGNPRSYTLDGAAGATLHRFVRASANKPVLRTPSGMRVAVTSAVLIPSQTYIERVEQCIPSEREAFHVCDE